MFSEEYDDTSTKYANKTDNNSLLKRCRLSINELTISYIEYKTIAFHLEMFAEKNASTKKLCFL